MKKLIQTILLLMCMCLFLIPQAVQAQEYNSEQDYYQAVQDNQKVYDFAELLDDSGREKIEEKIKEASEQSGLDIVVLTVNQMFGKTQREMADDFYDNGQFGFELDGKEDSGILLLIDMENRQLYISTAGTGIDYVDDDDWKEILDDIREYATDGNYVQVCETYADDVVYYAKIANSTFFTMFKSIVADLVIGAIIAAIVVLALKSSSKSKNTVSGNTYRAPGGIRLAVKEDHFIRRATTSRKIEQNTHSSSGSHSSVHTSSSGKSHGGGGTGF